MSNFLRMWKTGQDFKEEARAWWVYRVNRRTVLILVILLVPLLSGYAFAFRPPHDFPSGGIVTIEEGATLSDVAVQFRNQNIVRSEFAFKFTVMYLDGEHGVVAGDYQFKNPESVLTIARAVIAGEFGLEPQRIFIPEGSTVEEMAYVYAQYLPRFNRERFLEEARPLEGYLFPDTYFFLPNTREDVILRTMLNTFETNITTLEDKIAAFDRSLHEVVIIASLLEKEARNHEDRRKIAGVLWKRLEIGMPLQVDAAFLYILGRTTFDLSLEDLQYDSPYNTYRYIGLPAGPIDNPSFSSLEAALTPIYEGNLFYLADNSGITHFSATYEEHLRKKRIYLY